VICEKPLVLNPWNVEALKEIEQETGKRINVIFQVRHHPAIIQLKETIKAGSPGQIHDVDLVYITSRGKWYFRSWKGDVTRSGGVATNIGIHFFDMLIDIFGAVKENRIYYSDDKTVSGFLMLEKARIRWFLSLDHQMLPEEVGSKGVRTYRSISVDGSVIEFSEGFADLHTESYRHILGGDGFGCNDALPSIQTVYEIRNAKPLPLQGDYHPLLKKITG
jgi:UDP-N-acetyl-2-amino-2-deoxyglucuronate dehydrogenase